MRKDIRNRESYCILITTMVVIFIINWSQTTVQAKYLRTITTHSQLRDISENYSIISIRKYYSSVINHLAPMVKISTRGPISLNRTYTTTGESAEDDFEPFESSCVFTTVSTSFASGSSNYSHCTSVDHTNMPLDAAHYSYLVLSKEPTSIISPNEQIALWSLVMKNAMIHQTTREALWNQSISDVFSLVPLYEKPYVVDYVLDKEISTNRGEIVKEMEEQVWYDLTIFERGYEIQVREGRGLGFSSISASAANIQCNSTFYNSTFIEIYHESLFRIDFYISLMQKYSNLINTTGTIEDIPKIELKFKDDLIGQFNPTFLLESIRNVLQQGGFNAFLSYSKPTSTYDMQYYSSLLQSNDIKPISTLMIHSSCFSIYNDYAHQYFFRESDMLSVIFNDIIYFSIAAIGILVFLFNSVSYCLEFKLLVKKRILLPLIGPPTLIIISLCYTVFLRSQFSSATYWVLMFIVLFPAPILTGTYMVSLFRFSYLKNMEVWQRKVFKTPTIQKHLASTRTSVMLSIVLTVFCLLICMLPILGASFGILFTSVNASQEMFILMFAFEMLFILVLAIVFFIVDLVLTGVKIIKRKGLGYYFLYDDPFYYRIDLIIMMIMMTSVIPIIVGSSSDATSFFIVRKVFSVVFFLMFYLIIGGTVTIFHWINRVRRLFSKDLRKVEVTTIESFMEDQNFREMFRTYSKNEFAMENMLMFEELEKMKKANKVSPQDLKLLNDKYLSSSSVHEVNYPSSVKKSFLEMMESYTDEDASSNDSETTSTQSKASTIPLKPTNAPKRGSVMLEKTLELLMPELLKNMFDTFSRLKNTPEYSLWIEMKQIQETELGEVRKDDVTKQETV